MEGPNVTALRDMRNIGAVVAAELAAAGIPDAEALRAAGSVGAAIRLRDSGFDVCKSKLGGLEGAIRDITWHLIPADERAELWERLQELTDCGYRRRRPRAGVIGESSTSARRSVPPRAAAPRPPRPS
jgi:hypothetical protein